MPTILQDLAEAFAAIQGEFAPDAPLAMQVRIAVREVMDVIGDGLRVAENKAEFTDALIDEVGKLVEKLNIRPLVKRFALPIIEDQIPALVDQFALYAGTAQEFVDAQIVPVIDAIIDGLVDVRAELSSQPKPSQE